MLKQCHKELDGNKAVGIDEMTKEEYGRNLDANVTDLVERLTVVPGCILEDVPGKLLRS